MKKKTIIAIATAWMLICISCQKEQQFQIKGEITEAVDKTLFFEMIALDGTKILDSVRLGKSGEFCFRDKRPETPEFYRLRIGGNVINLGIDSTEIVTIKAALPTMATNYTIEGSEESLKIKELAIQQLTLQKQIHSLSTMNLPAGDFRDSVEKQLNNYKEHVKREYIYKAPRMGYAYYALFQRINGVMLFNPENNREDIRTFAAVATSWDLIYPHALRTINLHNITMKGLQNTRKQNPNFFPKDMIKEVTLLDLELPDIQGIVHRLSDLKGRVVLLDFTIYQNQYSSARNITLRELYNKYSPKGLEIYQVSFDTDDHFWKTSAHNLPWICVQDKEGYSARTYHVTEWPTYFLIDRKNGLYKRNTDIKDMSQLKSEIEKLLQE